jgi:leucyl-tRNA synthetase
MEFVNYFTAQETRPRAFMENFALLLSPMAPHIAEELWQALGHNESLAFAAWPHFDNQYIQESSIEIPIQINGKVRGRVATPADANENDIKKAALADPKIQKHLEGHAIRKMIVIPKKLVNIVIS